MTSRIAAAALLAALTALPAHAAPPGPTLAPAERTAVFKAAGFKPRGSCGTWRQLLDGVGVPTALATKQQGWSDIEVGGPGFGKFPVYRWNGKAYVGPK
jgi:hypothetical protein